MSRLNREASYLYTVDGETVWERLRVVRTFLIDRKQAYALGQLKKEQADNELNKDSYEYKEYLILKPQSDKLLEECKEEILFLEEFESKLIVEAEKLRIPGKTDDEMYEINFYEEYKLRIVKEAQSEIISIGHITPMTMKTLLRCKPAIEVCIQLGILNDSILSQLNISKLGFQADSLLLEG